MDKMLELAEPVDGRPSIRWLSGISAKNGITILAGFFERDNENRIYNTYVCVDESGWWHLTESCNRSFIPGSVQAIPIPFLN